MIWIKRIIYIILSIIVLVSIYGVFKPLPRGLAYEGEVRAVDQVEFIYDLTYEREGQVVHQQNILARILQIIAEAEEFIVLDMFLFNDDYNSSEEFPHFTAELTEALCAKKRANPDAQIIVITDEINTFYGSYLPEHLQELKGKGIEVIFTDLNQLRDSNPFYAGFWNTFLRWSGTMGQGRLPNIFSNEAPRVTLRSFLKMLNFKANHRKILITENEALITSANVHDASAYHSNIAFVVSGEIIADFLAIEEAVASLSGTSLAINWQKEVEESEVELMVLAWPEQVASKQVVLLTEKKIKEHLLEMLKEAEQGDSLWMGMFYLADRQVIKGLLKAAWRGVDIRLILDANKDAFGLEKIGIPNRPAADELLKEAGGNLKIRWYRTQGEQFHTKLVFLKGRCQSTILGGSANLTRRNLNNYNLEADLKIVADNESFLVKDLENYFQRLWYNVEGVYTVDVEEYRESALWKRLVYLIQEMTGLSSF